MISSAHEESVSEDTPVLEKRTVSLSWVKQMKEGEEYS